MTTLSNSFDPWGPISVALFDVANSDFVETAVSATGLIGQWRQLTEPQAYSHGTRVRARKTEINAAYYDLPAEHRGIFVQRLLQILFERADGANIREQLESRLNAIGWGLKDDGLLVTQEALLSEAYFPPSSQYDAYVSLRDVLASARTELVLVDGWLGATILSTIRTIAPVSLCVRFLTVTKNLRPDFRVELDAFRKQMTGVQIDVRGTSDFHDRFAIVDGKCFHIGASIKDAGSRAFMVSEIEDRANIAALKQTVEDAWAAGQPI